jgi:hypothetical protein
MQKRRKFSIEDLDKTTYMDLSTVNNKLNNLCCKKCKNQFWAISPDNLYAIKVRCRGNDCNKKIFNYLCEECAARSHKCPICGKNNKNFCVLV